MNSEGKMSVSLVSRSSVIKAAETNLSFCIGSVSNRLAVIPHRLKHLTTVSELAYVGQISPSMFINASLFMCALVISPSFAVLYAE